MKSFHHNPKIIRPVHSLGGTITVPGDKSISHRALLLGAIATGTTRIRNLLACDDCRYTARALRAMGVAIRTRGVMTVVEGRGLAGLRQPHHDLCMGNSGTSMRLLAGLVAGQHLTVRLSADTGLLKRPMRRIVEPLARMGVAIRARRGEYPPLTIRGGEVQALSYATPVASAQVKSAILLAGLYANGVTTVRETAVSRDHTERMMRYFGAAIRATGRRVTLRGGRPLHGRPIDVPADISSASFFIAGATILPGSHLTIANVSLNPTRDGVVRILKKMGADITVTKRSRAGCEPAGTITVRARQTRGVTINRSIVANCIDELPIICVVAAVSRGTTTIHGAHELRVKETDRIASIETNLRAMGADITVRGDTIRIRGVAALHGASLKSFGDHRTCMAMTIAALGATTPSTIDDTRCVAKSFPSFFQVLKQCVR